MNWIRWPVAGTDPTAILNYKNIRLGQIPEAWWAKIETSAGVYSAAALANLDSIISYNRAKGVSIRFGLYYVPTFYAGTTPNPTYADNVTKGPWAQNGAYMTAPGECGYPTSLTALQNFVTMIVNRYNKPGGAWYDANYSTLGKGIQSWEPWTEPGMHGPNNGNTTGVNGNGLYGQFWWGTGPQMVDLCATQYTTIKAIDPSIVVSTPSFSPGHAPDYDMTPYMDTVGTVSGLTGLQACDEFAWHPYSMAAPGTTFGAWVGDLRGAQQGVQTVKNWMASKGIYLSMVADEWGFETTGTSTTVTAFAAQPASFRYAMMARFLMAMAAFGVKTIMPWHWEISGPSGDWKTDLTGVVAAYNDVAAKVSGKTIVSGTFTLNGPVSLQFSDGTSWTV